MNLIEFLIQRHSTPAKYLIEPAPSHEELQQLMAAAESAPDHGALKPWRFLIISGSARYALGELFVQALLQRAPHTEPDLLERERERALRAPMLVVAIARLDHAHPKVPATEQLIAAAIATHQLMLAANHLGYGTIWLTGSRVYDRQVMSGLGLAPEEELIGLINIGTVAPAASPRQTHQRKTDVTFWQGE
ncbi:nitroreductase [Halothiobacillus sp.]|uniref:nitroreductase family protein n=1 Tax=Halothiobacillus sp. TaxID=1891311 RepID=UPI002613F6E0|nr:nitroreductase [Halothiobacillus sp.]